MKHLLEQEIGQTSSGFFRKIPKPLRETDLGGQSGYSQSGAHFSPSSLPQDIETLQLAYQEKCFALVIELASTFLSVSASNLKGRTRGTAQICQVRQICMYLLHTSLSIPYPDIGRMFCRDRTTISHACMIVEDLRDNEEIDESISRLESILAAICTLLGGVELPAPDDVQ